MWGSVTGYADVRMCLIEGSLAKKRGRQPLARRCTCWMDDGVPDRHACYSWTGFVYSSGMIRGRGQQVGQYKGAHTQWHQGKPVHTLSTTTKTYPNRSASRQTACHAGRHGVSPPPKTIVCLPTLCPFRPPRPYLTDTRARTQRCNAVLCSQIECGFRNARLYDGTQIIRFQCQRPSQCQSE